MVYWEVIVEYFIDINLLELKIDESLLVIFDGFSIIFF